MHLQNINDAGLRTYDVSYEITEKNPQKSPQEIEVFPRYILAFTGPSGVGKTTVSALLEKTCAHVTTKVPILTTRKRKQGDDDEYRYISQEQFKEMQKNGEIIAATTIPSSNEKRLYGYRASDIESIWSQGKIPIVVTEMHLLQDLAKHFGRRSVLSFGLLPPGKSRRAMLSQLLYRLRHRGRDTEEQIKDRLENAKEDLTFFEERKDLFDHILVNEDLDSLIQFLKKSVFGIFKGQTAKAT